MGFVYFLFKFLIYFLYINYPIFYILEIFYLEGKQKIYLY